VSKIIPYRSLARQQHLGLLRQKSREYREREEHLLKLRKVLFRVEAQMRQAEVEQLEVFRDLAAHFKISLNFPDLGDRVGLQELFAHNPFLSALRELFSGRLSVEECCEKIEALQAPRADS